MQFNWKMIQVGNENMLSDMQNVNVRGCVCMYACECVKIDWVCLQFVHHSKKGC